MWETETQQNEDAPFKATTIFPSPAAIAAHERETQRANEKREAQQYIQGWRAKKVVAGSALGDARQAGDRFAAHVAGGSLMERGGWLVVIFCLSAVGGGVFEAIRGKGRAA